MLQLEAEVSGLQWNDPDAPGHAPTWTRSSVDFSDALAFVETASHGLNAVEETGPSGRFRAELLPLRHGLRAVQCVYRELDLAIMALDEGQAPT